MKRIARIWMALALLCGMMPAGAESPLASAQQDALDAFVERLTVLEIPLGTQETQTEADDTRKAAIIQVLPEGKLWITYWEDGAMDIQLVVRESTGEAQREQVFTAFLEAFAPVEGPEAAQAAYDEVEAAFRKDTRGVSLEKEGYFLMLGLGEGEYMLSVLYP